MTKPTGRDNETFYVGYQPQAPAPLARWLRRLVLPGLAALGIAIGAFAGSQQRFSDAVFEFGQTRSVSGFLVLDPYPALLQPQRAADSDEPYIGRLHLVAFGKHGAEAAVAGLAGQWVSLEGTLIQRGQTPMLEIGSERATTYDGGAPVTVATTELGTLTLIGEIVDSKCHLGVMKPGEGVAHRACAIRCISGGTPPMLVTRNAYGGTDYWLLTDADGARTGAALLPFVGRPVQVSGTGLRRGDTLFVRVADNGIALR